MKTTEEFAKMLEDLKKTAYDLGYSKGREDTEVRVWKAAARLKEAGHTAAADLFIKLFIEEN